MEIATVKLGMWHCCMLSQLQTNSPRCVFSSSPSGFTCLLAHCLYSCTLLLALPTSVHCWLCKGLLPPEVTCSSNGAEQKVAGLLHRHMVPKGDLFCRHNSYYFFLLPPSLASSLPTLLLPFFRSSIPGFLGLWPLPASLICIYTHIYVCMPEEVQVGY